MNPITEGIIIVIAFFYIVGLIKQHSPKYKRKW